MPKEETPGQKKRRRFAKDERLLAVTARVPGQVWESIRELAVRRDVSTSEWLRLAIADALTTQAEEVARED